MAPSPGGPGSLPREVRAPRPGSPGLRVPAWVALSPTKRPREMPKPRLAFSPLHDLNRNAMIDPRSGVCLRPSRQNRPVVINWEKTGGSSHRDHVWIFTMHKDSIKSSHSKIMRDSLATIFARFTRGPELRFVECPAQVWGLLLAFCERSHSTTPRIPVSDSNFCREDSKPQVPRPFGSLGGAP